MTALEICEKNIKFFHKKESLKTFEFVNENHSNLSMKTIQICQFQVFDEQCKTNRRHLHIRTFLRNLI